jgi:glycosyltransferase involved in cell wall biosynthesis
VESVLAQDMPDWELIIVDDGSRDDTQAVLAPYRRDPRIQCVVFPENRGASPAFNAGLDRMRGEWFTRLDSDDQMLPTALSTLLAVPAEIDPAIDAVTCNCIDTSTGGFSGHGLDHDQYLDLATEIGRMTGEHWGLTRSSLLQGERLPEDVFGGEDVLWFSVSERAHRYYLHKALRIYHTEDSGRLTSPEAFADLGRRRRFYRAIAGYEHYLALLRRYGAPEYGRIVFNLAMLDILDGRRRAAARRWPELRRSATGRQQAFIAAGLLLGRRATLALMRRALAGRAAPTAAGDR